VLIVFDGTTENRVDASIALSSTDELGNATPGDGYGTPASLPATAAVNMEVIKYGRTTGQTTGKVDAINAAVIVTYDSGTALFTGQIIFKGTGGGSFSAGGDSGSLIVTASGHNPVSLLFAGNNSITVGNPINEVLAAFGVVFDAGSPTPTTTTTTTITTTTLPGGVVVDDIVPPSVNSGETQDAEITGSGFEPGATVTFSGGNGPTPLAANVFVNLDGTSITLEVVTKDGGPPRDRIWDLTVTNPGGAFGTAVAVLTVLP